MRSAGTGHWHDACWFCKLHFSETGKIQLRKFCPWELRYLTITSPSLVSTPPPRCCFHLLLPPSQFSGQPKTSSLAMMLKSRIPPSILEIHWAFCQAVPLESQMKTVNPSNVGPSWQTQLFFFSFFLSIKS